MDKELGDGVMASFNAVSDAMMAAIKIQETCTIHDLQLRIGTIMLAQFPSAACVDP